MSTTSRKTKSLTYPDRMVMTIRGTVPSSKNLYRIGRGRLFRDGKDYAAEFEAQVPHRFRLGVDWPLRLTVGWWPADMRRDLELELVPDYLQRAHVIKNDRQIWEKHLYRMKPDRTDPRVVVVLERLEVESVLESFEKAAGLSFKQRTV